MFECVEHRAFLQKIVRVRSWTKTRIHKPDIGFAVRVNLLNKIDIVLVAAGVLNFAPAQTDLALDSGEQCLLAIACSWFGNIFFDKVHRVIEQHSGRFTGRFQNLPAEWVRRVIVDLGDLERVRIRSRRVTIGSR